MVRFAHLRYINSFLACTSPNLIIPTTLSTIELRNILFSNSIHLANLDIIVSSLQMKNLNPVSLRNSPTALEQVMELDLNPGIYGLKASLPDVRLPLHAR